MISLIIITPWTFKISNDNIRRVTGRQRRRHRRRWRWRRRWHRRIFRWI